MSPAPTAAPDPATPSMPGINLGLARITLLLRALSSPQLCLPIVHISGTNGKGSVSAYLAAILGQSKLKTGRFNSPHLVDEWDCLTIDGRPVQQQVYESTKAQVERVDREEKLGASSFEILTATAFTLLAQVRPPLDLAIIEVGMGGSTDATNVVPADRTLLSIVTSIELDHQKFLGDTLEEIASVKGGIIREGGDVVVAAQKHGVVSKVLQEIATTRQATAHFAAQATLLPSTDSQRLVSIPLSGVDSPRTEEKSIVAHLPLAGSYQLANAAAATLAAQILRTSPRTLSMLPRLDDITSDTISKGIAATRWPGRLDWVTWGSKRILIDGAHNPSSALILGEYIASLPEHQRPRTLVLGLSFPRDPSSILEPLLQDYAGQLRKIICVGFEPPASMNWIAPTATADIAAAARGMASLQGVEIVECERVSEVLQSTTEETLLVAGSLYLAADVYRVIRKNGSDE